MEFHRLAALVVGGLGLAAAGALPAAATEAVFDYHIVHQRYGDIGTYANVVSQSGDQVVVRTALRVAVRILGIVMFREEADRTERWKGDRLVAFDGVTETNGTKLAIHGEAKGDDFMVTTPDGTVAVPGNVRPSNPWAARVVRNTDLEFSTKTGDIEKVKVSGGGVVPVTLDGKDYQLHRYDIAAKKPQFVWFDDQGVVVAFSIEEDGAPVEFILSHPPQGTAATAAAPQ
jgi:hypothetical protein